MNTFWQYLYYLLWVHVIVSAIWSYFKLIWLFDEKKKAKNEVLQTVKDDGIRMYNELKTLKGSRYNFLVFYIILTVKCIIGMLYLRKYFVKQKELTMEDVEKRRRRFFAHTYTNR